MVVCPKCLESNLRRSKRRFYDLLPRVFGLVAMRCNFCEHRFYSQRKDLDNPTDPSVSGASPLH